MIKDELEVAEFVKYLGIQTQSVYRRLQDKENRLQAYVVPNTKKVRIRKEALQDIYGKNLAELEKLTTQPTTQQAETPTPASDLELFKLKIDTLELRLADKDKQIADKDDYIKKQQEQIDKKGEEIEKLMTLLGQEQALNLQKQNIIDDMEKRPLLASADDNKKKWSFFPFFKSKSNN